MPSAGALVALVVLVTAGAVLADEPAFKPARLVSRFEARKPSPSPRGGRAALGLYILNMGYQVVPAGAIVSIWANKTTCGEKGDVNYKLPELAPFQTKAIKASWKVSETPGEATVQVFLDSACTAFSSSADLGQWLFYTMVVEAGTKYAYLEVAYPYSFLGTAPSEEGVKMGVYADWILVPDNASTDCTYPGQYSADIPKIAPGKTKVVAVDGIKAHEDNYYDARIDAFLDVTCKLFPTPVKVKTTPKKPKVNGTMTVKVKITNVGDAEGPVGRVVVFTTTLDYLGGLDYYIQFRCNPALPEWVPGSTYSFNTTSIVIKAGKSKTVKIMDVPVPATAGWWGLMVVPDADCVNAAQKDMFAAPLPYNVFEAVVP
ncbi:hypothetical protein Rsub_09610 [Raphidocelis subcapitata]|uniref:CARDB domain-containing protein n=1 Tax=Raphidocelis subcapitata TaxID=307507 RepID=A0A2V0PA76_9CHLO|nr:hypothetical protein Rsub_09610 [Raphidocelis subcapitata]|eukprot:GBF96754.1 hypothetical protein Rsub_09610 [Raphidocelis subcapitata]